MVELKYRLTLTEDMLGTVPKNKEVFSRYIANERTGENEIDSVPEGEESGYTGFFEDDEGIFLYDYHIKGFLKEAGNVLKGSLVNPQAPKNPEKAESPGPTGDSKKKPAVGIQGLRSKIDNYVFVFPRKIRLKKKPDGVLERPLRGMTAQGPRVSLAKSDIVSAGTSFEITVKLLPHKEITQAVIEALLDYGALKGLGNWRNASWGQFQWVQC